MADNTKIEWARHPDTGLGATWNPITGCSLVDEGCRHCFAARDAGIRLRNHPSRKGLARQNAAGEWKFTGEVRFNEAWLTQPLHWRRPRGIFVCAHGDLFHESAPDAWIDQIFAVMALCPQHLFFVLTKRPERAQAYLSDITVSQIGAGDLATRLATRFEDFRRNLAPAEVRRMFPLPNVWLGTSVSDQASAAARLDNLRATPAVRHFISAEPLLGPLQVDLSGIDWVIAGGESGSKARPMHPDWPRSLRDQCAAADVPFFFKQWGEWEIASDANGRRNNYAGHGMPDTGEKFTWVGHDGRTANPSAHDVGAPAYAMAKVGKFRAGRLLDGIAHDAIPPFTSPLGGEVDRRSGEGAFP